jgi:glycosyltransferase involved in cell wall biosynthesis
MSYGGDRLQHIIGAATYAWLQRDAWRNATAVVSFTDTITRHRIRYYRHTPKSLVISAPGVDTSRFTRSAAKEEHRALLSIPSDAPLVVSFCRLIPSKDLPFMFRSFALPAVPANAFLLVLGSGPEQAALEALAAQLGILARVRFAGYQERVEEFLALGDVYAFPSTLESFGLTLVQAMACELPAIARRSNYRPVLTSSDSIIDDGETGFLVDTEIEMAEKLRLVLLDRDRCREMGRAASTAVKARFTWDRHIDDLDRSVTFAAAT